MKSLTAALLLALVALPTHTPASSQVLNNMSGKTNVHNPTSRAALTQMLALRQMPVQLHGLLRNLAYLDCMVETRIAPRYRVLKAAKIECGGATIDCP
jgi:hypothetical protein